MARSWQFLLNISNICFHKSFSRSVQNTGSDFRRGKFKVHLFQHKTIQRAHFTFTNLLCVTTREWCPGESVESNVCGWVIPADFKAASVDITGAQIQRTRNRSWNKQWSSLSAAVFNDVVFIMLQGYMKMFVESLTLCIHLTWVIFSLP